MKHAIRRLREELLLLRETERQLQVDPLGAGGGYAPALKLRSEVRREIEEVEDALDRLVPAAETDRPHRRAEARLHA